MLLQFFKFGNDGRGDEVGTSTCDLPEFDERRPQLFNREADTLGDRNEGPIGL